MAFNCVKTFFLKVVCKVHKTFNSHRNLKKKKKDYEEVYRNKTKWKQKTISLQFSVKIFSPHDKEESILKGKIILSFLWCFARYEIESVTFLCNQICLYFEQYTPQYSDLSRNYVLCLKLFHSSKSREMKPICLKNSVCVLHLRWQNHVLFNKSRRLNPPLPPKKIRK